MTLERIIYYPIKSLRGIEVSSLLATPIGLKWDRRWMLVEESGHFVSQRKDPQLAQLSVQITTDGWLVSHPDGHSVTVPHERQYGNGIGVEVWGGVEVWVGVEGWVGGEVWVGVEVWVGFRPDKTRHISPWS